MGNFAASDLCMPTRFQKPNGCRYQPDQECRGYCRTGQHAGLIAADEFFEAVGPRWGAGCDWLIEQIVPKIVGKCTYCLVTALPLFIQSAHHDPIEFAFHFAAELGWFGMAVGRDGRQGFT